MAVDPKLKPLYANLKRLKIGRFLITEQFKLFLLENDLDDEWNMLELQLVTSESRIEIEKEEEILAVIISDWYYNYPEIFEEFIFDLLAMFAKWSDIKVDYSAIIKNLKELKYNKTELISFINEYRKIIKDKPLSEEVSSRKSIIENKKSVNRNQVFIVHGHDEEAKSKTARFVERLGFEAIILHEMPNSGKTIIEKLEEYSNVGFGIVLYTPCDVGSKNSKNSELHPRARQNVVFEHGLLIGKIGRENVCSLVKGQIEKPNDISGVVYLQMDSSDAWKYLVAKEMKRSGYNVDFQKV